MEDLILCRLFIKENKVHWWKNEAVLFFDVGKDELFKMLKSLHEKGLLLLEADETLDSLKSLWLTLSGLQYLQDIEKISYFDYHMRVDSHISNHQPL